MKKIVMALALATLGGAAGAAPLNFDFGESYVAAMGSYQRLDKVRYGDVDSFGAQFSFGLPVTEVLNLEATTFATYQQRSVDDKADLSYGLGIDALIMQRNDKYASFLLAGGGALREDISHIESIAPYVNIGAGFMGNLPFLPNLSYRAEVRGVVDFNKDGAPGRNKDVFIEPRVNVGLVYGFGYGAPAPVVALPVDSDGDGVLDPSDLCPNTPPGTVVDATGCPAAPADTDGDGVLDAIDQCPGTPPGTIVDGTGCPPPVAGVNPDLDADGVRNELDKCPGTPPSFKVDVVGCMVEQTVALQNVNFEFGSDQLTSGAQTILDGIGGSLLAQTTVKVLVTGHTDALGPQTYNLGLSQRRAKSVMLYLIGKGIEPTRLSADGEGEFSPVASNDTEEGRAQNRRVEFKITAQ
ncbi:MAG: OmpA family protein [Pseudomonadota bacterium]